MDALVAARRKKIALWVLIPCTILFLGSLVPAGLMIMFSPMAFDAGQTPALWAFVITLWIYPLVVLFTILAAWVSYGLRAYRLAMWWNLWPVIHILALFAESTFC